MGLGTDLGGQLDIGGVVAELGTLLGQSGADLGSIVPPVDPAARDGATQATAGISLDAILGATTRLTDAITPLLGRVPSAAAMLPAIEDAILLLEQAATPDLAGRVEALVAGLDASVTAEQGGTLGLVLRILKVVRQAPEADLLRGVATGLERLVSGGAPISDQAFGGFGELLPALTGAAGAIGALARLDGALEEAERVAGFAAQQLDRAALDGLQAEIAARLGSGPTALSSFVAGLDLDDAAAVATASRELSVITERVGSIAATLRGGMAFGEATIAHLDLSALRATVEVIRGEVRGADLAPLERAVSGVAERLAGVFTLDLSLAPAQSFDAMLTQLEDQLEALSERIGEIDIAQLLGPIGEGLALVTGLPGRLVTVLEEATAPIGDALDQLRDAVRALPLDDVANQLRGVMAAIAGAIETLTQILGGVEDVLRDAADQADGVLATAEEGIDGFKSAVDGAFAGARQIVETADLDAVAGEIETNIRAFLDVVAQADMTPFFDAASGAIGTAAGVVEQVPFDLLPDSMEQEVVDAIRPVKQVDVDGARQQIEVTLEIEDGRFNLRPALEEAVAGIKAQVTALVAEVRALDPEVLAAPLQAPLDDFRQQVAAIRPDLELAPLREAIDTAKGAIAGLDPAGLLQPVDQAFDDLIAAIDRFSPDQLVAPLDERIDAARESLIELVGLRDWRDRIDETEAELGRLIGLLDITTLERELTVALRAFQSQLADAPRLGVIDALLALLGPLLGGAGSRDALARAATWLEEGGGAAARLGERAGAIRARIDEAAAVVTATDPGALAAGLRTSLSGLSVAIAAHPPGPARLQLEASLSIEAPLAALNAMQAPWRQYLAALDAARQTARDLGAEGFSEADAAARRLAGAVAPLAPIGRLTREILRPLGLTRLDRGLAGLMEEIFAVASPKRLAKIATPLVAALRGRLDALVAAITGPIRTAIDDLLEVVGIFDLSPLRERLAAITAAAKAEIAGFRPSTLLAEPLAAFAAAKAAIAGFDPLGAVTEALDRLQARIVGILGKLDLGALLEQPIRLFAAIMEALTRLDVDRLLTPVLDQLDALAAQVQAGLEDTFGAFKRLQDALPDRVGGTTVGASASVSVG